jgi:hypothetical protein
MLADKNGVSWWARTDFAQTQAAGVRALIEGMMGSHG